MTKVVSFRGKSAPPGTIPKVKRASTVIGSELPAIKLNIVAERWRFYAYIAFWSMCILAIALSKIFVAPILAAGPEDGSTCGPFNRDAPEFGVELGQGFDMTTESHLQQIFGYNNICVNWDYRSV
ncbi:unnamed protein product [Cylindrotheca closterium]|uniref:Uncharacterized protein n=1 Tax=Cylindrotheca closterium TaxID=2856 RepID=A0AAD2G5M7_9STRA|nr:unnamed protein product [Cylindrotheca closterium]